MDKSSLFPRSIEVVNSAVIENDQGEILLTQSPKWNGKWVFPGGHIDPGETILESCEREGEEETGLKLKAVKIFNYGEMLGSKDFHRPAHFIFFDAHCRVIGGKLRLDEEELSACKWLLPKDALTLDLAESLRESIEAYIAYKG
jgi:nucleoside triphosphatase